jgi:hypothetical protein
MHMYVSRHGMFHGTHTQMKDEPIKYALQAVRVGL